MQIKCKTYYLLLICSYCGTTYLNLSKRNFACLFVCLDQTMNVYWLSLSGIFLCSVCHLLWLIDEMSCEGFSLSFFICLRVNVVWLYWELHSWTLMGNKNVILSELYKGSWALKPPLHLVTNEEEILCQEKEKI